MNVTSMESASTGDEEEKENGVELANFLLAIPEHENLFIKPIEHWLAKLSRRFLLKSKDSYFNLGLKWHKLGCLNFSPSVLALLMLLHYFILTIAVILIELILKVHPKKRRVQ